MALPTTPTTHVPSVTTARQARTPCTQTHVRQAPSTMSPNVTTFPIVLTAPLGTTVIIRVSLSPLHNVQKAIIAWGPRSQQPPQITARVTIVARVTSVRRDQRTPHPAHQGSTVPRIICPGPLVVVMQVTTVVWKLRYQIPQMESQVRMLHLVIAILLSCFMRCL